MAEKKVTTAATAKKAVTKKATAPKKAATKDAGLFINAESVGFRAGDVYQALSVAEIAKAAKISAEEAYLGIGWLFKEGKVKGENKLIALA